jgi:alkenylglycerophosphocholine/alkenylglycerophosphoethanolamine hydrolase
MPGWGCGVLMAATASAGDGAHASFASRLATRGACRHVPPMSRLAERNLPFLVAIAAFACTLFLAGLHYDRLDLRLAGKPWIHLALVTWILARQPAGAYARRIALGIAVCMVADSVLELRGAMFVVGMGLFLAGQLTFAAAFAGRTRSLQLPAALPVVAVLGTAFAAISAGLGSLRVPVTAYMLAIGTMMWRAAACVSVSPAKADASRWLALAGAVVFAASDAMIALDRFRAPFPGARYAIILTYWIALVLLAASAVRAPAEEH